MTEFRLGRALLHTTNGEVLLVVEIAETCETLKLGLMHRRSLPSDRGMLFILREPRLTGPHMENVAFPLTVAFADENGTILWILDMEPCEHPPCPTYDPGVPFRLALEVNRGVLDRLGVVAGDRIELV